MPAQEECTKVEPISRSDPAKKINAAVNESEAAVAKEKFDRAVTIADPSKVELRTQELVTKEVNAPKKDSIVDLSRKAAESPKAPPTISEIEAQATRIRKEIERPRAMLLDAGQITPSRTVTAKLDRYIEHIDRALQDVTRISGGGVEIGTRVENEKSPMTRFLNYLTESDKRLSTTVQEINALNNSPQKLTPEKLIAVQLKLNFIQQELEFFTSTLGKFVESVKTIMNVQI